MDISWESCNDLLKKEFNHVDLQEEIGNHTGTSTMRRLLKEGREPR